MKSVETKRPNDGWLEVQLSEDEVSHLWKCIDTKGDLKTSFRNISSSFVIDDVDEWFHDNVLIKLYDKYSYEFRNLGLGYGLKGKHPYYLKDFWVNYQKKHEFNPTHSHGGVYSFVVWMKIPTDWRDQYKLPFLKGIRFGEKKVSSFEFLIPRLDFRGFLAPYYLMSPELEGTMVFFPSSMFHQVYPFYDCEEDRISISGNIGIDTSIES